MWNTRELGKRNVCNAGLVESVEVALKNPFSHGRRCPAWLCVLADSSRPTGFILKWCRLVRGGNSRVWRRWRATARVQRRLSGVILMVNTCIQMRDEIHLYEGRAAKREPSQKIGSTIVLWV